MWEFRDNKLYAHPPLADQDDPDLMEYVCERVEVIEKRVNLITGEEFIKIAIQTRCGEKLVEGKRDILTRRSVISKLVNHGLSYLDNDDNIQLLLEVLWDTEALLKAKYFHEVTGFIEIRGSRCFLWDKAYGATLTEAKRASEYRGSTLLNPHGSPAIWRKLLIKCAAHRPSLAVVYGMGVSTFTAHILKEEGVFEEVLLWALIGDSSIGKTTLLSWQCSMLAHKRLLVQSFNATSNGFAAMLAERPGVGLYADEASHLNSSFDLDSMVYDLPRGRTKRRCKIDGTLQTPIYYGGAIIMSSERSILSRCKKDLPDQKVRLIELNDVFFSKGEEAEEIRDTVACNYGWGTEPLMTLLLSHGFTKKLVKKYQFFYKKLLTETSQRNGMDRRLLQRFAILLVSIWLAQKAFRVDMHLENCIRMT
ncbi:MAG: DUF927 domain-containing protein [Ruminococcaceae bacterium]|nr:DUF927 domain-containing protein [Oscillospiraceae bacterium]